jgi:single-stranded-DNA-specific exonuclease
LSRLAKRWELYPAAPDAYRVSLSDLPPLLVQILYNRQLHDVGEARSFLAKDSADDNPFQLTGMNEAVARLRLAIRENEPIAVYGDYDADGVTATALLVSTLLALGAEAHPYIPKRLEEGYGLNCEALSDLASRGTKVVVTVDCGVRSLEECAHARGVGLDLIVTDHHGVGAELPIATAVLDPHRADERYPYHDLAGVGLAYKLAQALFLAEDRVPTSQVRAHLEAEDLLDLVALGTVADLAPLTGENRALVWRGLRVLNEAKRVGIATLLTQVGVEAGRVDAGTIGFALGPRLNAAGRLDDAMASYELLMATDVDDARRLAAQLDEQNRERQERMAEMVQLAREQVLDMGEQPLYVLADARYMSGIAGLVASRITEEFYRPSLVIALDGEESRGSGRSISAFHLTRALDECRDLLVRHGGHAMAAGFSILNDRIGSFREKMLSIAARVLAPQDLIPTVKVDVALPLSQANAETIAMVEDLQPFGIGNPRPTFVSHSVLVRGSRLVGRGENTSLKLVVSDGAAVWDAIAFRDATPPVQVPRHIDLVYTIRTRMWKGQRRVELVVKDWRPAGSI